MPHINNLTYRIAGRALLEDASVAVPDGHKVGLVGATVWENPHCCI